jgi:hypothetical protein
MATECGVGECWSNCEQQLTKKQVVETCTKHVSSSLGPEPFVRKNCIAGVWRGNRIAVMDFACAKGPSTAADGFDMVIIRPSATNGSVSLWGGGRIFGFNFWFDPEWLLFFSLSLSLCLRIFATWDCVAVGPVGFVLFFNSCFTRRHSPYSWGNAHTLSMNTRNVVHTVWSVGLAFFL